MRTSKQRLAKGEKTQIFTKLSGFINREANGSEGFFNSALCSVRTRKRTRNGELVTIEEPFISVIVRGNEYRVFIERRR